jgi:hypothetical protein
MKTIVQSHESISVHVLKLVLACTGIFMAFFAVVFFLCGCQSVPQQPQNNVTISVNSIGNSSSGTVYCANGCSNDTERIQILVSFRDPISSSANQEISPSTSIPVSWQPSAASPVSSAISAAASMLNKTN